MADLDPKSCFAECFHREDCLRPLARLGPDRQRPGKFVWLVRCERCGFIDAHRDGEFDRLASFDLAMHLGPQPAVDPARLICEVGCCHICGKADCLRCHPELATCDAVIDGERCGHKLGSTDTCPECADATQEVEGHDSGFGEVIRSNEGNYCDALCQEHGRPNRLTIFEVYR